MQSGQNLKRIYQKQFVINERNENLMSNEKMNESLPAVASKTFDLSKEFSTVAEGEGSMIRTSTTYSMELLQVRVVGILVLGHGS